MTWGEFKALAEANGIRDDDTVFELRLEPYPRTESISVRVIHSWTGEREIVMRSVPEEVGSPAVGKFLPSFTATPAPTLLVKKADPALEKERPRDSSARKVRTPLRPPVQKPAAIGQALDPHARSYWGL